MNKYTIEQARSVKAFARKYAVLIRTSTASLKGLKAMMESELNTMLEADYQANPKGGEFYRAALCRCYWSIEKRRTREECLTRLSAKESFFDHHIAIMEKPE
ncbi:hypothetical protein NRB36_004321 [Salmonella enterica]|nr:hypothetical protein [Salmonella enterica]EJO1639680.1 hypothetical protein [Salmonella enterica]